MVLWYSGVYCIHSTPICYMLTHLFYRIFGLRAIRKSSRTTPELSKMEIFGHFYRFFIDFRWFSCIISTNNSVKTVKIVILGYFGSYWLYDTHIRHMLKHLFSRILGLPTIRKSSKTIIKLSKIDIFDHFYRFFMYFRPKIVKKWSKIVKNRHFGVFLTPWGYPWGMGICNTIGLKTCIWRYIVQDPQGPVGALRPSWPKWPKWSFSWFSGIFGLKLQVVIIGGLNVHIVYFHDFHCFSLLCHSCQNHSNPDTGFWRILVYLHYIALSMAMMVLWYMKSSYINIIYYFCTFSYQV